MATKTMLPGEAEQLPMRYGGEPITPDEALGVSRRIARVQIAQELLKRNEVDEAAPYAQEAVRLGPKNFLARKVLGQVELQAGRIERAIAELETARTLEPTSPTVRFQLARAYAEVPATVATSRPSRMNAAPAHGMASGSW